MEKEYTPEELDRIKIIKEKIENNSLTLKEVDENDLRIISKLYDYDIKKIKAEIKELDQKIDVYKKRMKEAIDYLDNM